MSTNAFRRLSVPAFLITAVLCWAHSATAQQPLPLAYPQDSTDGGWRNTAPLGQCSGGGCNSVRSQILIPRQYLPPSAAVITGLEVTADPGGTVTYDRLDITLDHSGAPQLDSTFANNLTSQANTVLSLTPGTSINYPLRTWTPIQFTTSFVYNGLDNLVVEFRKEARVSSINTYMVVPSAPRTRFDLPRHRNASGPSGSNTSNAQTAANHAMPMRMRLLFLGGPSLTVRSNRGGSYNFVFALGQPVTMTAHGTAGDLFAHLVDFGGLGLRWTPLSVPPVAGSCWLDVTSPLLSVLPLGSIGPGGIGATIFVMPDLPEMVGTRVAFQSVVGNQQGLSWTPATSAIVNW